MFCVYMLLLDCLYCLEVRVCMKRSLQILGVLSRLEGAGDHSCTCCTRLLWWKRISTWMWNSHFISLSLTSGNTSWVQTKRIKSWKKAAVVYSCYRKSGRTPRAVTLPTSLLETQAADWAVVAVQNGTDEILSVIRAVSSSLKLSSEVWQTQSRRGLAFKKCSSICFYICTSLLHPFTTFTATKVHKSPVVSPRWPAHHGQSIVGLWTASGRKRRCQKLKTFHFLRIRG